MLEYLIGIVIAACIIGFYFYKKCLNNQNNQNCIQFSQIDIKDGYDLENIDHINSQQLEIKNQNIDIEQIPQNYTSQISQISANRQMSSINSKIQQKVNTNYPTYKFDQKRQELVQEKINYIYDKSCRLRNVDENYKQFLGGYYQSQELIQQYSVKKLMDKQRLKQFCSAFLAVRGDGNCFYTAFGFQFLQILLFEYTNDQFYQFLKDNQISFQIQLQYQNIIDIKYQQEFRNEFFYRLERLKLIDNIEIRKQKLFQEFRAYEKEDNEIDGCFYGLATIFFRNLAQKAVELYNNINDQFDKQILFQWEVECNENEIVISSLANFLKLFIQLLFFSNGDFQVREYGLENNHKIILLIRPGHYNIGIKER